MPAAPLYVFSLGPIPTGTGFGTVYLGYFDGVLIPTKSSDADDALAELRKSAPIGVALACAPELAKVGALHGFRTLSLPPEVVRARAQLAAGLAHVDLAPTSQAGVGPLLEAAAAFWAARPWDRLPVDVAMAVEIVGGNPGMYEGACLGAAGDEFGVALYPVAGSIARIIAAVDAGKPERVLTIDALTVTLADEPAFAVSAVVAGYGLPRVPLAWRTRRGQGRPLDLPESLTLAATLHALCALQGEPGASSTHTLTHDNRTVRATVHLRDADTPPPDALPRRFSGRRKR